MNQALMTEPEGVFVESPASGIHRVGTLEYTSRGLLILFTWLLWGDFCFTIFESIFGKFLPLYMADLHASNTLIGIMSGSVAGALNILLLPGISMWSDRYRSPRGRRIPFLFWSTPGAVVSLVLIGFAPEIAACLHAPWLSLHGKLSVPAMTLGLLCLFVVSYHFFNMVLVNLYQCLLRDVVPPNRMARFLALFRVVGTVSGVVFYKYLFPHLLDHRRGLCLGVGAIYLASFSLMCWKVQEGEYPESPLETGHNPVKRLLIYFRECLSVPLYRDYLILYACVTAASTCAGPFVTLFAKSTLNLDMQTMGRIFAWSAAVPMVLYPLMGYICEKGSPIRVTFAALLGFVAASVYVLFFVHDQAGWFRYAVIVSMVPSVAWGLGQTALTMQLFPTEKFGQLSSSLNVLGFGSIVVGNTLAGWLMDYFHGNYRIIFIWSLFWFAAAIIPMLLVYRSWKQHGGPSHYIAPLPTE